MTKWLGLSFASYSAQAGVAMSSKGLKLVKTMVPALLVAVGVLGAGCGGPEGLVDETEVSAEEALIPVLNPFGAVTVLHVSGTLPPRAEVQREVAQDISPDPIPAREGPGSVVTPGSSSETSSGSSSSSETQGTTKR